MKSKTTLRIKDCKLVKHKVIESKDKVFVLLIYDRISKELDVPEFVNRGRQN